jgi:hypothetical protein
MGQQQVTGECDDVTIEVDDGLMSLFSFLADSGLSRLNENPCGWLRPWDAMKVIEDGASGPISPRGEGVDGQI